MTTYFIAMSHNTDPHSWSDYAKEDTLKECAERFMDHVEFVARYADETQCIAYVFVGDAEVDCPDYKFSVGPRGGIKRERV